MLRAPLNDPHTSTPTQAVTDVLLVCRLAVAVVAPVPWRDAHGRVWVPPEFGVSATDGLLSVIRRSVESMRRG